MVKKRALPQPADQTTLAIEPVDLLAKRRRPGPDIPHTLPPQLEQKRVVFGGKDGSDALPSSERRQLAKNLGRLKSDRRMPFLHVIDVDLSQPARHGRGRNRRGTSAPAPPCRPVFRRLGARKQLCDRSPPTCPVLQCLALHVGLDLGRDRKDSALQDDKQRIAVVALADDYLAAPVSSQAPIIGNDLIERQPRLKFGSVDVRKDRQRENATDRFRVKRFVAKWLIPSAIALFKKLRRRLRHLSLKPRLCICPSLGCTDRSQQSPSRRSRSRISDRAPRPCRLQQPTRPRCSASDPRFGPRRQSP